MINYLLLNLFKLPKQARKTTSKYFSMTLVVISICGPETTLAAASGGEMSCDAARSSLATHARVANEYCKEDFTNWLTCRDFQQNCTDQADDPTQNCANLGLMCDDSYVFGDAQCEQQIETLDHRLEVALISCALQEATDRLQNTV